MSRLIKAGATSQTIYVSIQDSSSTTGGMRTGLAYNTASLIAYYTLNGAAAVAITLATQTAAGAWSSGGFVEVDATHAPGLYRLDLPNAAVASGVSCVVTLSGAATMVTTTTEIQLTAVDNQDAVRMGLTALPNAAAESAGGLYTRGTGAGQIKQTNNGEIDANATHINNVATTSVTTVKAVQGLAVDGVVTTVTNQLTAAQIAAGVWQDTTSGDFTTASSIGKSLYTSGVVPGGSGGLFISGSNSGTTTLGAMTVTGALTVSGATVLTGNVSMAAGLTITQSSSNASGLSITGNGTGHGILATSGSGVTGNGIKAISAASAGNGIQTDGAGSGDGFAANGGTSGNGIHATGGGTGAGLNLNGGGTGNGMAVAGGGTSGAGIAVTTTSGDGISVTPTAGHGLTLTGQGTTKHGLNATGGATTSHGASFTGGGVGHGILATSGSGASGNGIQATVASTNGNGIGAAGNGSGDGINTIGGSTGNGINARGGSSSGDGILGDGAVVGRGIHAKGGSSSGAGFRADCTATNANAFEAVGDGTGHGMLLQSGAGATGDGLKAIAASTDGNGIEAVHSGTGKDILGNLYGSVTSVTDGVTADVTSINSIATSSVTAVNANIGTTEPVNFTGTGASALAKSDVVDIAGTASAGTAGYVGIDWGNVTAKTSTVDLTNTTIKGIDGVTFPTHFSALSITSDGLVTTTYAIKKNTALANFMFVMTDSTTHEPLTGLTVTCTRSIDGGAFANCTNTPATEVSNGYYKIDLSASDLNGTVIAFRFTAATADDLDFIFVTQ